MAYGLWFMMCGAWPAGTAPQVTKAKLAARDPSVRSKGIWLHAIRYRFTLDAENPLAAQLPQAARCPASTSASTATSATIPTAGHGSDKSANANASTRAGNYTPSRSVYGPAARAYHTLARHKLHLKFQTQHAFEFSDQFPAWAQ